MEIKKTPYYISLTSADYNGKFEFSIQKDCSQIRLDTGDGDVYIDVNYQELKTIRDAITEVLEGFNPDSEKFETIPKEKFDKLITAVKGMNNSMLAHPDCTPNSEFEGMVERCDQALIDIGVKSI